jgi:hypothetical protein
MNKPLVWIAVILCIVLLALSAMYFTVPGGSLPAFLPGHVEGSAHIHLKHAVGALVLALVVFAFAWFQSGSKKA